MLELAICDDDIILCNWLEQKLLHYGKANDCQISIEIYYSAEQLLNRLEEESYDMLFLDICLEHENGIDIGTKEKLWKRTADYLYFNISGICYEIIPYSSI